MWSWMNAGTSESWEEVVVGVYNALDVMGSKSGRLRGLISSGRARIALLTDSLLSSTNAFSCWGVSGMPVPPYLRW